jgi:hypothetical protein
LASREYLTVHDNTTEELHKNLLLKKNHNKNFSSMTKISDNKIDTAYFRRWRHKVHWGLTMNTDKENRSTKPDISLVDNTKSYIIIIVVHTAENIEMAYQNKIQNYII